LFFVKKSNQSAGARPTHQTVTSKIQFESAGKSRMVPEMVGIKRVPSQSVLTRF